MLYDLLAGAIGECAAWCGRGAVLSTGHDTTMPAAAAN